MLAVKSVIRVSALLKYGLRFAVHRVAVLLVAAVLGLFALLSPYGPAARRVEILFTGGIDGNLDGCECFGYPDAGLVKLAAYLRGRDRDSTVLLDGGDAWEAGSDPALATELSEAFADLGYDAAVLGDQEFANGPEFLEERRAAVPVLGSANLFWDGRPLGTLPRLLNRGGLTILVLPLTGAESFALFPAEFRSRLTVADPAAVVAAALSPPGSTAHLFDLLVLLYHGGFEDARTLNAAARRLATEHYGRRAPAVLTLGAHGYTLHPLPPDGSKDKLKFVERDLSQRIENLPLDGAPFFPGTGGNRVGRLVYRAPLLRLPLFRQPRLSRAEYRVFNYRKDPDDPDLRRRVLRYNEAFTAATGIERDYHAVPSAEAVDKAPLEFDYFYSPNCASCLEFIHKTLPAAAEKMGRALTLRKRNIMDPAQYAALRSLLAARGQVFTGVPVLSSETVLLQGQEAIARYLENHESLEVSAATSLPKPGAGEADVALLPVLVAGLLDGVNPCAFSAVLFLVSTLALSRVRGRRLFLVGLSFCIGVFVAYFGLGLGAFAALRSSRAYPAAAILLRWGGSAVMVLFAILSFRDGVLACSGRAQESVLQLPTKIKLSIHALIRSHRASGAAIVGALGLGMAVSALELGCTGQIYLPTLVFMAKTGGGPVALALLTAYNLAFIAPLLGIFALAIAGVSSRRIGAFFASRLVVLRFATATLFAAMALLLALR